MIPFLVPDPSMLMDSFEIKKVEVPAEIRNHCIRRVVPTVGDQLIGEKWKYVDCVWKNMGYYGGNPSVLRNLRRMRDRTYLEELEGRDELNKVNYKVEEILEKYYK